MEFVLPRNWIKRQRFSHQSLSLAINWDQENTVAKQRFVLEIWIVAKFLRGLDGGDCVSDRETVVCISHS